MIIDFYTKAILTVIAVALVLIALNPWIVPRLAQASYHESSVVSILGSIGGIESYVAGIESYVGGIEGSLGSIEIFLAGIYAGRCRNPKIC